MQRCTEGQLENFGGEAARKNKRSFEHTQSYRIINDYTQPSYNNIVMIDKNSSNIHLAPL